MAFDNTFVIRMVLIAAAFVVLTLLIMKYQSMKKTTSAPVKAEHYGKERFEQQMVASTPSPAPKQVTFADVPSKVDAKVDEAIGYPKASEPLNNEDYKAVDFDTEAKMPSTCFPRDRLTTEDLLPKDAANSKWAQVNPAGQGDVKDQNFLTSGFHIGTNTVGQSLRNANYQLRSDPPNPKMNVGPWNQTTIEYDVGRRNFEISEC
jgi:hypothetical protein